VPAIADIAVAVSVFVIVIVATFPFSSCVYKHTSFGSCASHFIRTANCYYEAFKGANDREYHRSALL
jgi:hypothetical protein